MSNMDKYFKKKLTDYSPAEDKWNIPSDKIWEQAVTHFPRRKNTMYKLWRVLGFCFVLVGISIYFNSTIFNPNSSTNFTISKLTDSDKLNTARTKPHATASDFISLSNKLELAKQQIPRSPLLTEKMSTAEEATTSSTNYTETTLSATKINPSLDKTSSLSSPFVPELKIARKSKHSSGNSVLRAATNLTNVSSQTREAAAVHSNTSKHEITENKSNNAKGLLPKSLRKEPVTLAIPLNAKASALPSLKTRKHTIKYLTSPDQFRSIVTKAFVASTLPIIKPGPQPFSRREAGVSSMKYLISFIPPLINSALEAEGENNSRIHSSFTNINLNYSKFFSSKWSVSSGINYSEVNLQFNLDFLDTLSCSDLGSYVNNDLGNQLTGRESSCPAMDSPVDINEYLKPGVTIGVGEALNIKGDLLFDIQLVQLPVILTRHWAHKNFEITLGMGVSLDHYTYNQFDSAVDLHRNGESILKNPFFDVGVSETNFIVGSFLDAGLRINIGRHMNLGFGTSLNITQIYLTGLRTGLYYRW